MVSFPVFAPKYRFKSEFFFCYCENLLPSRRKSFSIEDFFIFQALKLVFQALEHVYQVLEPIFQALEHKIPKGENTFSPSGKKFLSEGQKHLCQIGKTMSRSFVPS